MRELQDRVIQITGARDQAEQDNSILRVEIEELREKMRSVRSWIPAVDAALRECCEEDLAHKERVTLLQTSLGTLRMILDALVTMSQVSAPDTDK